jgi:hypothetical protein
MSYKGLSTVEDFIDTIKKLFVDGSADKESIKKALNQHGYDESSFKIVDESKKNFKGKPSSARSKFFSTTLL